MSQLVDIESHWIDPDRVISVVPLGGPRAGEAFFIHVDMGGWTASHEIEIDEDYGWTIDSAATFINENRTK